MNGMNIQQRILQSVARTNWILLLMASATGGVLATFDFAMGILAGGLIVTINFHFMYRLLKKTFSSSRKLSLRAILAKYYLRQGLSVVIIFILITRNYVSPGGLLLGLSIVVASIMIAALSELKKIILKEAA
jgi:hypothetical protein